MTDRGPSPLAANDLQTLLAATLASLLDFVGICTPDGRVVFINPAGRRLTGLSQDADVSQLHADSFHTPDALRELHGDALPSVLRDGQWNGETTLRTITGEHIPVSIAIVIQRGAPGHPFYLATVMRDLRGRVRTEEALRDSEARAHFLADAVPTQVWTSDTRGIITWANQCACRYLGRNTDAVRAMEWTDIAHPDDWAHARSSWAASRESGEPFHAELRLRRADGAFRWHTVRASAMRDSSGVILQWYGTSADIDDARTTRDALERERAFLAAVLENLSDGVVACDAQGQLTLFNRATREFHGLPESRIPSEEWSDHYALYRPDGRTPLERAEVPLFRALQGEEVRDAEMVIAPRDLPARTLRASGRPLRAADGTIAGAVVVMRDVTNTRRLEEQLRQAQKMEAVGQLAGGVAHDFNNLLTAISFSVEFLRAELPPENALRADVDQIGEAAERAAALTGQLLAFGRRQRLQPRPVNLNDCVASVMRMLPRLIRADIKLRSSGDSRAAWTVVDPGQVEQVIVNLILNARDALPDGGEILVATHVVALTTDVVHPHGVIRTGDYAVVSVSDNGSGMDDATLTRLFEPFFTTKERGKGTGLGLATVHGIVEQSGGSVVVSSMQSKGTTFAVYFPLHLQTDDASLPVVAAPGMTDALPTVLLVDDEALVLQLGERTLARAGYSVVTAANGETALELLADGRVRSPFLLVTDVTMPGMGGFALADEVGETYNPDATLFISGFTTGQQLGDGLPDASRRVLLSKPFSAAQLLEAVQRATGPR